MSDPSDNRMKTNRVRERYLKRRRRQQALLVAAGVLAVVLLGSIVLLVVSLRSCSLSLPARSGVSREASDERWAREVLAHDFKLAPWFIQLGDDRLYSAADSDLVEPSSGNYHVNQLEAFTFDQAESAWQSPIDESFTDFILGDGRLVGFRLYRVEPLRLHLSVFDASSGAPTWDLDIPDAEDATYTVAGRVAVVGFRLADGFRLVGYNLLTQAKAWGMRLPLDGLLEQGFSSGETTELELYQAGNMIAYARMNVVGLVNVGTGERLREYAAAGCITDLAWDTDSQVCYLVVTGNQYGTFSVQSLPFKGSTASEVCRYKSHDGEGPAGATMLSAAGGNLALAYPLPLAGSARPQTQLFCRGRAAPGRQVDQALDGLLGDLVPLPDQPGEYLVALNAGVDESTQQPRGRSELWRLSLADGTVRQVARFKRPVLALAPFKADCLVLLGGGEIISYLAGPDRTQKLRKTRYPMLKPATSPNQRHLAVYAWPAAYADGRLGQPFQVIVFE